MLITLAGITGIGKSYFKEKLSETLNLKRITTITTRERRDIEKNITDRLFMTDKELNNLISNEDIAYYFSFPYLNHRYAYLKKELFSNENSIVEIHYSTIYDWKKIVPNIYSIYLIPHDIEKSKQMLIERNLSPELQEIRLKELEEHYQTIKSNQSLLNQFDSIFYNNYDLESENKLIELVKFVLENNQKY